MYGQEFVEPFVCIPSHMVLVRLYIRCTHQSSSPSSSSSPATQYIISMYNEPLIISRMYCWVLPVLLHHRHTAIARIVFSMYIEILSESSLYSTAAAGGEWLK